MVEPSSLTMIRRDDGSLYLPSRKYAELDLLSSWMQCSVSSQESIDRYEELTQPDELEKLCMDYHELADENQILKKNLAAMAELLRSINRDGHQSFGDCELGVKCREAVLAYDAKYGTAKS